MPTIKLQNLLKKININKNKYSLLLLILIIFHLSANTIWVSSNTYPGLGEEFGQLSVITYLYRDCRYNNEYTNLEWAKRLINNESDRPPLLYILSLFILLITGFRYSNAVIINSLLFVVLILTTFSIGKKLKNESLGFWAALVLSFFVPIFVSSRVYNMVTITITITTCFILSLLETESFRKRYAAFICGIVMGLGLLTKQHFIIFAAGPVLYFFYLINKNYSKERLINLLITLTLATALGLIFYHRLGIQVNNVLTHYRIVLGTNFHKIGTASNYLKYLLNQVFTPCLLLLFLIGIYFYLKDQKREDKYLALIWIIAPLILLSLSPSRRDRYYLPLLPAFAIFIAYGIENIRSKLFKLFIYALTLYFSIFWFLLFSFPMKTAYFEKMQKNIFHKFGRTPTEPVKDLHPMKDCNVSDLTEMLDSYDRNSTNIALVELVGFSEFMLIYLTELDFKNVSRFEKIEEAFESDSDLIIFTSRNPEHLKPFDSKYTICYNKNIPMNYDRAFQILITVYKKNSDD